MNIIEERIQECIRIGESLQTANKLDENPFYTYLSHLNAATKNKWTLDEYYEQTFLPKPLDLFTGEHALPDISIQSLGGNFNPVYKIEVSQEGVAHKCVLKANFQSKDEYWEARKALQDDVKGKSEEAILGGSPISLARNNYAECVFELWPLQRRDLNAKMKDRDDTTSPAQIYRESNLVLSQTLGQLARLERLGLGMTDLKPGNIYLNDDDYVKFADDKGLMNTFTVNRLNELDVSPGFVPIEMYGSKDPIDIKQLGVYQLMVTMDCFIKGKTLSERARDLDDPLQYKDGDFYSSLTPPTPYKPDFSDIDIVSASGKVFQMLTSRMQTLSKEGNINFQKLSNMASGLINIREQHPGFLFFLHDQQDTNPDLYNRMVSYLEKGAESPKDMIKLFEKDIKKNRSWVPFKTSSEYRTLKTLRDQLKQTHFPSQQEIDLQSKFSRIFTTLQEFRDIQNSLQGIQGQNLTKEQKIELYERLDVVNARLTEVNTDFKTALETTKSSDPDLAQRFELAYKQSLQDGFIDRAIKARYEVMQINRAKMQPDWKPGAKPSTDRSITIGRDRQPANDETNAQHQINKTKGTVAKLTAKFEALNQPSSPKDEKPKASTNEPKPSSRKLG